MRSFTRSLALLMLAALAPSARSQTPVEVPPISLASPGVPFNEGIRGQAIPSINQFRPPATIGTQTSLDIARGSSLRGVAGGLEAELYDWRTRNNDQRSTTLDYLRFARDYDAKLVITANIRGLTEPDPTTSVTNDRRFYDTSSATLAKVAADWVRYTNVIAQTYRQGDVIADPQDQAILNSLVWTTGANDTHPTLPAAGEAALPKVTYWEIGNEPRVGLASSYLVTNSYTFLAPGRPVDSTHKYDFHQRYAALTAAMRAVDPTIKVGPAMQWLNNITEREILNTILAPQADGQRLPVDFIGYHPYQTLFSSQVATEIEGRLRTVYDTHSTRVANIRSLIAAAGRNPSDVELIASETNVSNHTSNGTENEARMAHALGTVEEVFSFARLGVSDAHYWLWPADGYDWTEQPVYKAYEGLRDHLGDTLVATHAAGNQRLYTTRNSATGEIALWGLNFANAADASLNLSIANLPATGYTASLKVLKAKSGPTTLFSANLPSYLPGGPSLDVDWHVSSLTGTDLSTYTLPLPAATISVLVITPNKLPADFDEDGAVDAADLLNWKFHYGGAGTMVHAQGDADSDCDVDGADFLLWQQQLGSQRGAVTAAGLAVPEPNLYAWPALAAVVMWRLTLAHSHYDAWSAPRRGLAVVASTRG